MAIKDMTRDELIAAAKNHRGSAYNPYRRELERREASEARETRSASSLRRELDVVTQAARANGYAHMADHQAKVADLEAKVAAAEARETGEVKQRLAAKGLTAETTPQLRAAWNEWALAAGRARTTQEIAQKECELGWNMSDLRLAIKVYDLPAKQ